jgi:tetratricopeptide (TPR) repeat protein
VNGPAHDLAIQTEGLIEHVGTLVPLILEQQVLSSARRGELMGTLWQRCVEEVRANPAPYLEAAAEADGALRTRLSEFVRTALPSAADSASGSTLRSGSVGTFIDAQLRDIAPSDPEREEGAALREHPLISDAIALATAAGNETLLRNLRWMILRDEGRSYEAIAKRGDCPTASVRTGVRRARQAVRRVAQQRRRAATAPHQGRCPSELEAARDAWKANQLDEMARALQRAHPALGDHPYFWFLTGLWADDSGEREEAIRCFERVLLCDDDTSLRAKVLNCLGSVADDAGDLTLAHLYWSRAARVDPQHTPAHVNLLKSACDRKDALDLHVCIDRIGELLASRTQRPEDKEYLVTRLREHPDFEWARSFESWQRGPARWIARHDSRRRSTPTTPLRVLGALGLAGALLLLSATLTFTPAHDPAEAAAPAHIEAVPGTPSIELASGDRGGHSGGRRDRRLHG